jgi:TolC family type I secretion outer membrane protein
MAAVAFAVVAAVPVARAQRPSITLAEALRLAEQVQPSVVQAEGQVRTAGANIRSAKGAYLPSLSLSGSGAESYSGAGSRVDPTTNQIVGTNWTGSAGATLSASVDLFTGFRRRANLRAANAAGEAAAASLVDAHYQLRLTTTNQFFSALSGAQLVEVRMASVREAEEQLRAATAKLRAGTATRADTLTSRVNLGTAQLNLATAQSDLAAAEAGLARLVGRPGRIAAADDSTFYQLPMIDTTTLRTEALERSPQVQSALANARAARAGVAAARAAYWPTLSFGAATGYTGTQGTSTGFSNNSQLTLRLSWNLFNGFAREATIVTQESSADLAEATASDDARAVDVGITTYLAQLDAAATSIAISQSSVAAGEENLRVVRERYQLGVATIVDLLTSQAALDQAKVDAVNARFDYLRAKAQLEALVAHPL